MEATATDPKMCASTRYQGVPGGAVLYVPEQGPPQREHHSSWHRLPMKRASTWLEERTRRRSPQQVQATQAGVVVEGIGAQHKGTCFDGSPPVSRAGACESRGKWWVRIERQQRAVKWPGGSLALEKPRGRFEHPTC
jgi:hypothetical protein